MTAPNLSDWLDPAFIRATIASNEAAAPALPMRQFRVTVGDKKAPRLSFTAIGTSSTAVFMQHVDLATAGERVVVLAERGAA
jgi:hypothetical protein